MKKLTAAIFALIIIQALVLFAVSPERTKADQSKQQSVTCQTQCDTKYKNVEGPVERHFYQNIFRENARADCKINCKKAHVKRMREMGWEYNSNCHCIMHKDTLEVYDAEPYLFQTY